jgi:excisionase family DNA binding protein
MEKSQQDKLSIGKASGYLGVAIETLRRWDSKGKIKSYRSPGGHRYFLRKDLDNLFARQKSRRKKGGQAKMTPRVVEHYPKSGFSKKTKKLKTRRSSYKKPKKRIAKNLPIRRMFLFLLVFFAAVDIVLIFFYFFARNLTPSIPYF